MHCTQKDMRERLGFTRDQLRLYERRGIITPEIDPDNGYRYYDDWQVNLLLDCRYYQGMGFSLSQIERILRQDTLAGLEARLVGHERELSRELRYREMVLGECRQSLRLMREVEGLMDNYRLVRHEGCMLVPLRRNHELCCEPGSEAMRFSARHPGLMTPYFWFPDIGGKTYYWGFAMRATAFRELEAWGAEGEAGRGEGSPPELEGMVRIDAANALVTCVDAGGRGGFGCQLFEGLFAEAGRRGFEPAGGVHGILVARTHDEVGGYHRYIRAYLPVV